MQREFFVQFTRRRLQLFWQRLVAAARWKLDGPIMGDCPGARRSPDPPGIGANAGPRHLRCCSWLLLLSLSALLLLQGSLLLPGSLLLLRADTPVQQMDARGLNASLIRGLNLFDENRTASAALGSDRAAGMPPHALESRSG